MSNDAECLVPTTISKYKDMTRITDHIHANKDITICNLANGLGKSSGTYQNILTPDVNIQHTVINFVSCVLSYEKKEKYVHVCQVL
jgi:hypothetical protein